MLAEYPHLIEAVGGYVTKAGYDYDTEFVSGLDLILDGLDKLRYACPLAPKHGEHTQRRPLTLEPIRLDKAGPAANPRTLQKPANGDVAVVR